MTQINSWREEALDVYTFNNARVQSAVEQADLILGFDVAKDKQPSIFYGKANIQAGKSFEGRVISFLFDSRTDSVVWLVRWVKYLKGSCCYNKEFNWL